MGSSRKPSGIGRIIGGLLVLLLVIAIVGLLFVDWRAAAAIVGGLLVGAFVRFVLVHIWQSKRRGLWIGLFAGVVVIGGIVIGGLSLLSMGGGLDASSAGPPAEEEPAEEEAAGPPLVGRINLYRVTVRPGTSASLPTDVQQEVVYTLSRGEVEIVSGEVLAGPAQQIFSEQRGFLLREVRIKPWETGPYTSLTLTAPDGDSAQARICSFLSCVPAEIEVIGLPRGSFYAARGVPDISAIDYVNEEIVEWTTNDVSGDIIFAYIPPPFHILRPLLAPFVGASTASDWTVGLITLVGTVIATPLVKPILEDIIEDKIAEFLRNLFGGKKNRRNSSKSR